jgi:hypothetical protein
MTFKIKRKNLNRLIKEVLHHGRDFDVCLLETLLLEAANISSLASRAIKQGKCIVVHSEGGRDYVMVVNTKLENPEVVAASIGEREGDWWRLQYLYSKEISSTPLALLGALSTFKKVIPDLDVSPAAEILIKNYFDNASRAGDPDPELIELDADEQRVKSGKDKEKPHLRAGYFPLPGTDSMVSNAIAQGKELIKDLSTKLGKPEKEIKDEFAEMSEEGFSTAYESEQTGYAKVPEEIEQKLSSSISAGDFSELSRILYSNYTSDQRGSKKSWIPKWLKKNQEALLKSIKNTPGFSKDEGLKYLDQLLGKIVEKEEDVSGYSILALAGPEQRTTTRRGLKSR